MREDYQELIDAVSARLDTPALLEARDFTLIAFGAHDSEDDRVMDPVRTRSILRRGSTPAVRDWFESFGIARASEPVRIPPEPAAGVRTGRICLPARHGGVVYGYIWLLDDGRLPLSDPRLAEAGVLAERIGGLLAGEARSGALLGEVLHTLLTAAPSARPTAAGALDEALGDGTEQFAGSTRLTMAALAPWRDLGTGSPAGISATAPPGVLASTVLTERETPTLAAVVRLRSDDASVEAAVAAAARLTTRRTGALAGVGTPVRRTTDLPQAWRQARAAVRAAAAEQHLRPVARWRDLGPYRLLTALPETGAAPPDPSVAALLAPAHRELARTAECYLDCAGQAGRTATALGIHRQTLYYRLSRVSQLTGLDLSEGADRLLLHMSLKAARL